MEASDELGRKGQELRVLTRDLDLLKLDFGAIAMVVRLRGAPIPPEYKSEESASGEE